MAPDEIHMRDLLRPITGGGQERLKEVGVRARAYSKFFNLWEALHVVTDQTITYIRDDVIQYLESVSESQLADVSILPRGDIIRAYESYRWFLASLSGLLFPWTAPYFSDHMTMHAHFHHGGRGIVLSGNDIQAPYFLSSIESFRRLGCDLPVEIMYLGENDLGDDWRMKLEAIGGVTTRDLSKMVNSQNWAIKGWASKSFALLMSSFREVIYLDADALFFTNPEILFEDPGYKETGALFFKDRMLNKGTSRKDFLKDVMPKPISLKAQESRFWTAESSEQQESGVLVVDKWRHLVALLTITRMNGPDRDDNPETGDQGMYSMFYGDKETFWLGFELAGDMQYSFYGAGCGIMGTVSEDQAYTYTPPGSSESQGGDESEQNQTDDSHMHILYTIYAPQLLHLDLEGRPLWWNGWLLDDKYVADDTIKVTKFNVFMDERKETGEYPEWACGDHNMCRLRSNQAREFTEKERETLNMIVQVARENGALGQYQ
ncbi:putative alpha-1,3-mannosyltransferase [Delphinella strobiligena]|nr:putative alpha-1,3-mannosyltransferase [Delphinella strobiligena]